MTVEEGLPQSGIGAEIIAAVTSAAFEALAAAPVRLAGEDVPMPYAESASGSSRADGGNDLGRCPRALDYH